MIDLLWRHICPISLVHELKHSNRLIISLSQHCSDHEVPHISDRWHIVDIWIEFWLFLHLIAKIHFFWSLEDKSRHTESARKSDDLSGIKWHFFLLFLLGLFRWNRSCFSQGPWITELRLFLRNRSPMVWDSSILRNWGSYVLGGFLSFKSGVWNSE